MKKQRRYLQIIKVIFACSMVFGCSTKYITHEKGQLPLSEIAVLETDKDIYVYKIDNQRLKAWEQNCYGRRSNRFTLSNYADEDCFSYSGTRFKTIYYDLLPGFHTITCYWAVDNFVNVAQGTNTVDISFTAEKGKKYSLKSNAGSWTLKQVITISVEEIAPNSNILNSIDVPKSWTHVYH